MRQRDIYYQAVIARDYRFDGKFFIGVKTTGIYCRPICPAKPKRENMEFFRNALLAEKAGYRPCMRCRPECAPGSPAWNGKNTTIDRALKLISQNGFIDQNEDQFANHLGVSARHLRRLFQDEFGKTPRQIFDLNRLNFARKLLYETSLPVAEIAFSAGFRSLRRFNDAVKKQFHASPTQIRSNTRPRSVSNPTIQLALPYRPPLHWDHLLDYYRRHQIESTEKISESSYSRVFKISDQVGAFRVSLSPNRPELNVEIKVSDTRCLYKVSQNVRKMFDLDSDPLLIANSFSDIPLLDSLYKNDQGLRLPSGWDAFEILISTVLGQLVSVKQARSLVGQIVRNYGERVLDPFTGEESFLFPTPAILAQCDLAQVKTTEKRRETIRDLANKVRTGNIVLERTQNPEIFKQQLLNIAGVGVWSAEYISMRALSDTDAFPGTDLILKRVLRQYQDLDLERVRPWRAYAAIYLWNKFATKPSEQELP